MNLIYRNLDVDLSLRQQWRGKSPWDHVTRGTLRGTMLKLEPNFIWVTPDYDESFLPMKIVLKETSAQASEPFLVSFVFQFEVYSNQMNIMKCSAFGT